MYNRLIINTYFLKYFCLKIQKNKNKLNTSFKFFTGKCRILATSVIKFSLLAGQNCIHAYLWATIFYIFYVLVKS